MHATALFIHKIYEEKVGVHISI